MRPIELLEREEELARLGDLLDAACAETSSVCVIEGPAGIGKTALLRAAVALAGERDMRVLTARGTELERGYPFGVAVQLVESALVGFDSEQRDRTFAGAAALTRSLFDSGVRPQEQAAVPEFRTLHGLYWLFANLCQERPMLVVIDDVQWADAASMSFLAFLVKRLEGLPVLVALARRTGDASADPRLIDSLLADRLATMLRPHGFSLTAVDRLVRERLVGQADDDFVAACLQAGGGNPFYTTELLTDLARRGVEPTREHLHELLEVSPAAIVLSVLVRLVSLGDDAQAFARALAVLGDDASLRHAAGLGSLEEPAARRAADALAAASILEPGGTLAFAHPVLRGAVHSDISPHERAGAHARAAELLAADGAPAEQVAVHLLVSDPAADQNAVDILSSVARRALAQGAPDAAATYLRRALAEPPVEAQRVQILRDLGTAESALGRHDSGAERLRTALELCRGAERPLIARALAVMLLSTGQIEEAVAVLAPEIEELGPDQRDLSLQLEADLIGIATQGGLARDMIERHSKHRGRLAGDSPGERMLLAVRAYDVMQSGGSADEAVDFARRALAGGALLREHTADSPVYWTAVQTLICADYLTEAGRHIDDGIRDAGARGSVLGRAVALLIRSARVHRLGQIRELETHASETLDLARLANWRPGAAYGVGYLVLSLVERAELSVAGRLLEDYGMTGDLPLVAGFDLVLHARAQLSLARGRADEALAEAHSIARRQEERGVRSAAQVSFDWRGPAVLANIMLDRRRPAVALADELLFLARAWGRPGSLARALHLRALAEDADSAQVVRLREAVEMAARSESRFEHVPALVDLGATLRRLKRPGEARAPLREGLELAERLGATLLADRARAELEATGEHRRKTQWLTGIDSLTPSERRVADMAAEGMSNKEIAQALFVTMKTIEVHLTQTYRKLGISSRGDLPAALTTP